MALTKVSTNGVKDDAVTTDKLANAINTERTANTAKASITINNNADNRVITGSGTANTLEGESTLTYGGTELLISNASPSVKLNDTDNSGVVDINNVGGAAVIESTGVTTFATNGSERMRIDSSGNVGIGTTAPVEKLGVDGGIRLVTTNGETNRITSLPSGTYSVGVSGGAAIGFTRTADGAGGSDQIIFETHHQGTSHGERMRIDKDGKVGIGTTSPTGKFAVSDGTVVAEINPFASSSGAFIGTRSNHAVLFKTNATERMRIDTSGRLLLNTTSHFYDSLFAILFDGTTQNAIVAKTTRTQNTGSNFAVFLNSSGGVAGQIYHNGATTVQYITTSDYRLKENQTVISDGITRLKTLKPYRFNFIEEPDKTVDGFFAHEVGTVVPEAIKGTKDEVDSDNNPVYQGIDQSKLVPLLTAALQEAVAKIEVLETKVAALEAG